MGPEQVGTEDGHAPVYKVLLRDKYVFMMRLPEGFLSPPFKLRESTMRRQILGTASVFVIYAQTLAGQQAECTKLIALSRLNHTVIHDQGTVAAQATQFCNEYSQHKDDSSYWEGSASYKFFSASLSHSSSSVHDIASRYCGASSSNSAASDAYQEYIESIAPGAYAAYAQCLVVPAELKFSVDEPSVLPSQFTMSVNYISSVLNAPSAQIVATASSGVSCKWNQTNSRTISLASGSSGILDCSRTNPGARGFVNIVRTNGPGQLTIPWQAYDANGLPLDLLQRWQEEALRLRSEVQELKSIPVGTVIAFAGTMADAERQTAFGWWIADGRTIADPASPINGGHTADLRDRFLMGSTSSGSPGGAASYRIPDQTVNSHTTGEFGAPSVHSDPFTHMQGAHGWTTDSSIYSAGTWQGSEIPTVPPYYRVIYLQKVK
jgi:hypothetical protein